MRRVGGSQVTQIAPGLESPGPLAPWRTVEAELHRHLT